MNYVIFDIETRIDKELLREIVHPDLPVQEAYERHKEEMRQRYYNDFISLSFHIPVAISVGLVGPDHRLAKLEALKGRAVGKDAEVPEVREYGIAAEFWSRTETFGGCLVTYGGRGFDLPVLELAALRYGLVIKGHLEEKYGARYRYQTDHHLDLAEFLGNYGAAKMRGGLQLMLRMLGYPGKGPVRGSDVQMLWETGQDKKVSEYCTRDVFCTYLLFLHVQAMRGIIPLALVEELASSAHNQFGQELGLGV